MSPATAEIVKEPELEAAEVARALVKAPSPSLMPVFRGQQMTEAFLAYRELQKALDAGMPDQLMNIRGKVFRKKGYWRAIATAFNLNVSCVKEEAVETGWLVVYRAATPSGRFIDGDGACEHDEKGEGQDSEHNVRSHAHTRAFNRAVSNLVGFGEVSAEEVRAVRTSVTTPAAATPALATSPVAVSNGVTPSRGDSETLPPGAVLIVRVDHTSTKNPNVTKHLLTTSTGETFSTIKDKLAAFAEAAVKTELPVVVVGTKTKWGLELVTIARAEREEPARAEYDDAEPVPF